MCDFPMRFCKRLNRKLLNFQGSFNIGPGNILDSLVEAGVSGGGRVINVTQARFIALRQEVYTPKINKIFVLFKQIYLFIYIFWG